MTESVDLDRIATEVRAVAKECGALIVETVLSLETRHVPVAAVPATEFVSLIRHIRPRLVYLVVASFDAIEDAEVALDVDAESPDEGSRAKEFAAKWHDRNGQSSRLVIGVMCDGVVHGAIETVDWFDVFDSESVALKEELEEARAEREERDLEESEQATAIGQRNRIAPLVKKLIADPRFSASKVGVAKRTVLAQALFPDLDKETIRAIVEQAENEHWLATS